MKIPPLSEPEIVTDVDVATDIVVIMSVALVATLATITLAGTVAAVLLLDNVTTAPLASAALLRFTVPVEEA